VIGSVLYYSDLGTKTTAGLNVVTGKQVFSFPDGAFNPVIADNSAIYLDGYSQIYQMLPGRHRAAKAAVRRHHAGAPNHKRGAVQARHRQRTATRRAARRRRRVRAVAKQPARRVRRQHNRPQNRK
jgi:hypothetical protein